MSNMLCVYYSRTGKTEALMQEIARELGDCEIVKLDDGINRSGLFGWLRSGMDAMARQIPAVARPETKLPLNEYDLVIVATPVWAGRCSAPVRSFLRQFGEELQNVAYVITRASEARYEEVFQQMDLYAINPHIYELTVQPGTIGVDFWKAEFLAAVRGGEKREEQRDA